MYNKNIHKLFIKHNYRFCSWCSDQNFPDLKFHHKTMYVLSQSQNPKSTYDAALLPVGIFLL